MGAASAHGPDASSLSPLSQAFERTSGDCATAAGIDYCTTEGSGRALRPRRAPPARPSQQHRPV